MKSLLVCLLGLTGLTVSLQAQEAPAPIPSKAPVPQLTVMGTAKKTIKNDIAEISVSIDSRAKSATDAQNGLAQKSQAVLEAVQSLRGVKVTDQQILVNPQYDYVEGRSVFKEFLAQTTFHFETEADKAGQVVDKAIQAGANRLDGLNFRPTDENRKKAELEALNEASGDAMQRADAVLQSLGLRKMKVLHINVMSSGPSYPRPMMMRSAMMDSGAEGKMAAMPTDSGETDVNSNIELHIAFE